MDLVTNELKTEEAINIFVDDIEDLMDLYYKSNSVSFTKQFEEVNAKYNNLLTRSFLVTSVGNINAEEFVKRAKSFVNEIKEVPQMHITISFVPEKTFVAKLYDLLKKLIPGSYVISVDTDESLLGGLVISFQGKYIDLSLSKALSTYLSSNKSYVLSKL